MVVAVVSELNPFHNGHAAIFRFAKNLAFSQDGSPFASQDSAPFASPDGAPFASPDAGNTVLAVMSGNYCQRGEPALLDKWTRARVAINCGADAVAEIPSVYSQQSAQFFAGAAIDIICKSGIVDAVVFGSETGDLTALENAATVKLSSFGSENFRLSQKNASSYPRAIEASLGTALSPNDILAVEYLCSLKRRNSHVRPVAFKRIGETDHNSISVPDGAIASAAFIRNTVSRRPSTACQEFDSLQKYMPEFAFKSLKTAIENGTTVASINSYSSLIIGKIRELGESGVEKLPFAGGGLASKIYDECCRTSDVETVITNCTGKAFTSSRIRRILLSVLTSAEASIFTENDYLANVPYIRLLAVRNGGNPPRDKAFLTALNRGSAVPVIAGNIPKTFETDFSAPCASLLKKEILATDLYVLGFRSAGSAAAHKEFTTPLIKG